ncbi:hypothetical protein DPMN_112266 [Dreissena polymorpha]|uniref:Uncharacterized protein n=1 Tax=Dreissena polymorpha TaxID=45954 RepID=A0A9D4KFC2_DREPO|nr:hypothetical protein DPMN_112266 [Dreissena polymorpha]
MAEWSKRKTFTPLRRYESALLMILGFGGFSIILALHIFHDEHNLDTTFDAGGNVSLSLTAVTVASQLIWPGDILHSATLTAKQRTTTLYVGEDNDNSVCESREPQLCT